MKITIMSWIAIERIANFLGGVQATRFTQGYTGGRVFGNTYTVLPENVGLRACAWRTTYKVYRIQDDLGDWWIIPEWLVLDIEEEDGDTDEDQDYYG